MRELRVALDAPLKLGRSVFPAHAEAHLTDRRDGTKQLDAAARLSATFDRFNLGAEARYQRQYLRSARAPPGELSLDMIGSGHIGAVRQRLYDEFNIEIGAGLGPLKGKIWRVGLMGHGARVENIELLAKALRQLI